MRLGRRQFLQATAASLLGLGASKAGLSPAERKALLDCTEGRTRIVFPQDGEAFERARRCWNRRLSPVPLAVAYPPDEAAVALILAWARHHGVGLSLRSGGHCFEDTGVEGNLVVDLAGLSAAVVDSGTLIAGPGASIGKLSLLAVEGGLLFPVGSCSEVGVAGYTLGGGYGLTARWQGLASDLVGAMTLIDGEGRKLRLGPDQNEDLFWACRGAGTGTFGVVTSLEFRLAAAPSTPCVYRLEWRQDAFYDVFEAWQQWAPSCPPELTPRLVLRNGRAPRMSCQGLFIGPCQRLSDILRPLVSVGDPLVFQQELPLATAIDGLSTSPPPGNYKIRSLVRDTPLSTEATRALLDCLVSGPARWSTASFEPFGGRLAEIDATATAFPHREALFLAAAAVQWRLPGERQGHLAWLNDAHRLLSSGDQGGCYANYRDSDLQNEGRAYYGRNLERLLEVRSKRATGSVIAGAPF